MIPSPALKYPYQFNRIRCAHVLVYAPQPLLGVNKPTLMRDLA